MRVAQSAAFVASLALMPASTPDSFADLVSRLGSLPSIVADGLDVEAALSLDDQETLGQWAKKTWQVLLALSDYAQATQHGRCDRDVHGYLRHTPDGCHNFSAQRHARDESDDVKTNGKYRKAREFPVPVSVDPTGRAFMGAHFKIAQRGLISPRVHYLDATSIDGNIYVGYIGPHLPTKKTN